MNHLRRRFSSCSKSHVSFPQKALLIPYFSIGALTYPERGDFVAGLGDLTSQSHLIRLKSHLNSSSAGRKLLIEKPLINSKSINLSELETYDQDSFGYAYHSFLSHHGYSPDDRTPVRYIQDPDLLYIMTRYRQIHDFWHILSGLPVSVLGELGLKRFEWYVTGFPLGFLSSTAGQLRLSHAERAVLYEILFPWAQRCASNAKDLIAFRYEDHLHLSLDQARDILSFEKAPDI
jgi:ubiquinone biosynthesis protein COQ4